MKNKLVASAISSILFSSLVVVNTAQAMPGKSQIIERCSDSPLSSLVASCAGDSLTGGTINSFSSRWFGIAGVSMDVDHAYNLYDIHWLAKGDAIANSVKMGYVLTDCNGEVTQLVKNIQQYNDVNGAPANINQLKRAAGVPVLKPGNFFFYSKGPYSSDTTYQTDPTKCSDPIELNTTTSPNHLISSGAATTDLAPLASTSPATVKGESVQFISRSLVRPKPGGPFPGAGHRPFPGGTFMQNHPHIPPHRPFPHHPMGSSEETQSCEDPTMNGHWGEVAFVADITEDASGNLNGTYTSINVGGDATMGTSDDVTHSGVLTGNHAPGASTASVTFSYTIGGAPKTVSGTLNLANNNEINGDKFDFEDAPQTHVQAVRNCN